MPLLGDAAHQFTARPYPLRARFVELESDRPTTREQAHPLLWRPSWARMKFHFFKVEMTLPHR